MNVLSSYQSINKERMNYMGYNDDSEKKAHRMMAVFFLVIIIIFIGFKAYENSKGTSNSATVEPTATVEVTEQPAAE